MRTRTATGPINWTQMETNVALSIVHRLIGGQFSTQKQVKVEIFAIRVRAGSGGIEAIAGENQCLTSSCQIHDKR